MNEEEWDLLRLELEKEYRKKERAVFEWFVTAGIVNKEHNGILEQLKYDY